MVAGEPFRLPGLNPENVDICTIEATVTTGFEGVAAEECSKRFETKVIRSRGRIVFDIAVDNVRDVLSLKCIDNVAVLIGEVTDLVFKETKEECLQQIREIVPNMNWEKGVKVWKIMTNFELPLEEIINKREELVEENVFSFRITCNRVGKKHHFQSPDASKAMGALVNETFFWKVDLTKFNLQILLNICDNFIYVGLALVKESLHRRNLKFFGPTTLRPTISHCMLRLASIRDGDVVCDPVCGSGSIVIEEIISWPNTYHICGDIHDIACSLTKQNIEAIEKKNGKSMAVDVFKWDATSLPIPTDSIDVIVTDLPFGKKVGNKRQNQILYPKIVDEFARVVKVNCGRAVILTADRNPIYKTLKLKADYWKVTRQTDVNIGGLSGVVFVLKRTQVKHQ